MEYSLNNIVTLINRKEPLPTGFSRALGNVIDLTLNRGIYPVTFKELCTQLKLKLSKEDCSKTEMIISTEYLYRVIKVLERFGVAMAPCSVPRNLSAYSMIYLLKLPDLTADQDIATLQRIAREKKSVHTNNELLAISNAKTKLYNYNLLLRVFEFLGAAQGAALDTNQRTILQQVLDEHILPHDGSRYIRTLYSYACDVGSYCYDYSNDKYVLKPLSNEDLNKVLDLVVKTIAPSRHIIKVPDDFPWKQQLENKYHIACPHAFYEPEPEQTIVVPISERSLSELNYAQKQRRLKQRLAEFNRNISYRGPRENERNKAETIKTACLTVRPGFNQDFIKRAALITSKYDPSFISALEQTSQELTADHTTRLRLPDFGKTWLSLFFNRKDASGNGGSGSGSTAAAAKADGAGNGNNIALSGLTDRHTGITQSERPLEELDVEELLALSQPVDSSAQDNYVQLVKDALTQGIELSYAQDAREHEDLLRQTSNRKEELKKQIKSGRITRGKSSSNASAKAPTAHSKVTAHEATTVNPAWFESAADSKSDDSLDLLTEKFHLVPYTWDELTLLYHSYLIWATDSLKACKQVVSIPYPDTPTTPAVGAATGLTAGTAAGAAAVSPTALVSDNVALVQDGLGGAESASNSQLYCCPDNNHDYGANLKQFVLNPLAQLPRLNRLLCFEYVLRPMFAHKDLPSGLTAKGQTDEAACEQLFSLVSRNSEFLGSGNLLPLCFYHSLYCFDKYLQNPATHFNNELFYLSLFSREPYAINIYLSRIIDKYGSRLVDIPEEFYPLIALQFLIFPESSCEDQCLNIMARLIRPDLNGNCLKRVASLRIIAHELYRQIQNNPEFQDITLTLATPLDFQLMRLRQATLNKISKVGGKTAGSTDQGNVSGAAAAAAAAETNAAALAAMAELTAEIMADTDPEEQLMSPDETTPEQMVERRIRRLTRVKHTLLSQAAYRQLDQEFNRTTLLEFLVSNAVTRYLDKPRLFLQEFEQISRELEDNSTASSTANTGSRARSRAPAQAVTAANVGSVRRSRQTDTASVVPAAIIPGGTILMEPPVATKDASAADVAEAVASAAAAADASAVSARASTAATAADSSLAYAQLQQSLERNYGELTTRPKYRSSRVNKLYAQELSAQEQVRNNLAAIVADYAARFDLKPQRYLETRRARSAADLNLADSTCCEAGGTASTGTHTLLKPAMLTASAAQAAAAITASGALSSGRKPQDNQLLGSDMPSSLKSAPVVSRKTEQKQLLNAAVQEALQDNVTQSNGEVDKSFFAELATALTSSKIEASGTDPYTGIGICSKTGKMYSLLALDHKVRTIIKQFAGELDPRSGKRIDSVASRDSLPQVHQVLNACFRHQHENSFGKESPFGDELLQPLMSRYVTPVLRRLLCQNNELFYHYSRPLKLRDLWVHLEQSFKLDTMGYRIKGLPYNRFLVDCLVYHHCGDESGLNQLREFALKIDDSYHLGFPGGIASSQNPEVADLFHDIFDLQLVPQLPTSQVRNTALTRLRPAFKHLKFLPLPPDLCVKRQKGAQVREITRRRDALIFTIYHAYLCLELVLALLPVKSIAELLTLLVQEIFEALPLERTRDTVRFVFQYLTYSVQIIKLEGPLQAEYLLSEQAHCEELLLPLPESRRICRRMLTMVFGHELQNGFNDRLVTVAYSRLLHRLGLITVPSITTDLKVLDNTTLTHIADRTAQDFVSSLQHDPQVDAMIRVTTPKTRSTLELDMDKIKAKLAESAQVQDVITQLREQEEADTAAAAATAEAATTGPAPTTPAAGAAITGNAAASASGTEGAADQTAASETTDERQSRLSHDELKETARELRESMVKIAADTFQSQQGAVSEAQAKARNLSAARTDENGQTVSDSTHPINARLNSRLHRVIEALAIQGTDAMVYSEFNGICVSHGLISGNYCIEELNEYSFEEYDEPVLELDGSGSDAIVYITTEIISELYQQCLNLKKG